MRQAKPTRAETVEPGRYLTEASKRDELAHWADRRRAPRPAGDRGGHGYADPEMFGPCERLNAIKGVCTLQSCAGHDVLWGGGHCLAQLWIWVDMLRSARFYAAAAELSDEPGMENVTLLWRNGREIMDVSFRPEALGRLTDRLVALFSEEWTREPGEDDA